LQLGFNRRFDPSFSYLQKRVQAGEIGVPHVVKITSRDPACPTKEYCATSGGIFMDMSIHDFDMARFLTRSEVIEVYATGSVLINPDFKQLNDVDTAIIQLRFANGALGVIDNSRQAVYGYDQRIEVFGSEGMLLAANQVEHAVTQYSKAATATANPQYFFLERYQQAYIAELTSFYDAWANNKPSPVAGEDGLSALRIAKAAKQSLETQLPVVLD
jgi:myo-inositol 2-dehydrogenase/D-chiro-inositol 1-dehydrogenase